jgi:hypothetical protein
VILFGDQSEHGNNNRKVLDDCAKVGLFAKSYSFDRMILKTVLAQKPRSFEKTDRKNCRSNGQQSTSCHANQFPAHGWVWARVGLDARNFPDIISVFSVVQSVLRKHSYTYFCVLCGSIRFTETFPMLPKNR